MGSGRNAFVIGAGSAGIEAAVGLARAGWDVSIAEPSGVGGTCLWTGCVPKKSLYVTARNYAGLERDPRFGVLPQTAGLDWPAAQAWKRRSQTAVAGDQEQLLAEHDVVHVPGVARFLAPDRLEAHGTEYTPDAVVIATGARTVMPPLPGIELGDTSGSALSYRQVPETLTIVGGGYIGMEFAGAYAPLGSKVTMIVRGPRVLPMFDAETALIATEELRSCGVDVRTGCNVTGLSGERGAVVTHYTDSEGKKHQVTAQHVLMAVGRRANVDHLDLAAGGIQTDDRGRLVLDAAQRTTNPRVWAAGDAAGTIQLKPAAEMAGRLVARSIATGVPEHISYGTVPSTVFTLPQVAQVGLTEEEAGLRGVRCIVRKLPFGSLPAAIIEDRRSGLIKLVFDAEDGRLIGAHIAAPQASELIYSAALAVRAKATEEDMREQVAIHAAFCEGLNFAALQPAQEDS